MSEAVVKEYRAVEQAIKEVQADLIRASTRPAPLDADGVVLWHDVALLRATAMQEAADHLYSIRVGLEDAFARAAASVVRDG